MILCARASAVPPPKTSVKGAASIAANGADRSDDMQILFDRRCSDQAEVIRDSAEIDRRFIAQPSAP